MYYIHCIYLRNISTENSSGEFKNNVDDYSAARQEQEWSQERQNTMQIQII